MSEMQEVSKAVEVLKQYCVSRTCGDCVFGSIFGPLCTLSTLNGISPANWDIPKPCRWTQADLQLAKALKAARVIKIHREYKTDGCIWITHNGTGALPKSAFTGLDRGETVNIDTIIKGAKNER